MIIDSAQLLKELDAFRPMRVVGPRDERFFCPSVEWLKEFALWFVKNCHPKYRVDQFDCDDYTFRLVDRATDSLLRANLPDSCGHTILYATLGIRFDFTLNGIPGGGSHATGLVRCADGWYFCEPQSGLVCPAAPLVDGGMVTLYDVLV